MNIHFQKLLFPKKCEKSEITSPIFFYIYIFNLDVFVLGKYKGRTSKIEKTQEKKLKKKTHFLDMTRTKMRMESVQERDD